MKIGSSHDLPALDGTARGARAGAAAPLQPAAGGTDQVDVSAAGAALARSDGTDFDHAKVEAIRTAIREGRFTVNAGAIADQLIADAAALLAPRPAQ